MLAFDFSHWHRFYHSLRNDVAESFSATFVSLIWDVNFALSSLSFIELIIIITIRIGMEWNF